MTTGDLTLQRLHEELGWPLPADILSPAGGGPAMYAKLAREKIGRALSRMLPASTQVEVGVLVSDPNSEATEAPFAVVCHFAQKADAESVAQAHRLAWNFCHAPILIVVDPTEIRTWSCFVAPGQLLGVLSPADAELPARWAATPGASLSDQAARSLHWLALVSGQLVNENRRQFKPEGRADRTLLTNLKEIRRRLISGPNALTEDMTHDLIARLMFLQFLFDRKDAKGISALNARQLAKLHADGTLRKLHPDLASVLSDYRDTYGFFAWLNDRFNGDLFPAKSEKPAAQRAEWRAEMQKVRPEHLTLLSDLVSGRLSVGSAQIELWRLYSFDAIPLEFVSSIYEEFVSAPPPASALRKKGAPNQSRKPGVHYTPTYLVDFVLDAVLPWSGKEWDLKILDPACGSGIFLVRAFQRLVYRWKGQHPGKAVPKKILTHLLERCLFGVDIDAHAARVASFSLYLAMCDEIDPRAYWANVRFPTLRGRRILSADFFQHGVEGFDAVLNRESYDLVVGNAPWGKNTMTEEAGRWAAGADWPVSNKDIGTLFLGKALGLTREGGRVAMIQPAGTLLLNASAKRQRTKLFAAAQVEEVVNFTIIRFHLFPNAASPACSVVIRKSAPDGSPTTYMCPKLLHTIEDGYRIVIDDTDVNSVDAEDVLSDHPWNVLMSAGPRELDLVRRLAENRLTLRQFADAGHVSYGEGVIPGETSHSALRGRLVLFDKDFPEDARFHLDPARLKRQARLKVHRKTNPALFETPQLLIKQGWVGTQRLRALLVAGDEGVVCSQSYVTARALTPTGVRVLDAFAATYGSMVGRFYLAMTGGRMAYRSELRAEDIYDLPLPSTRGGSFFPDGEDTDADALSARLFGLRPPERALIEDALAFSLPELVKKPDSEGRRPTSRNAAGDELLAYAAQYIRVLGAGNSDAPLSARVFEETEGPAMPLRMVAIHFGKLEGKAVSSVPLPAGQLREKLERIGDAIMQKNAGPSIRLQRVATVFDVVHENGRSIPTAYLIRPDQKRFWSRAAAMRDADRMLSSAVFPAALSASGRMPNDG